MKKKIKEMKEVVTITELCDFCGMDLDDDDGVQYATVCATVGEVPYPEVDNRERYEIDVCGDCFVNKIVPTLEREYGIKFQVKELG